MVRGCRVSPRISAGIDITGWVPRSLRPLDRVRAAVAIVEAQGLKLSLQREHGVGRHQVTGSWVAEGPYRPRRVSLAAAVCLVLQPEGLEPEDGAAAALDVAAEWVSGMLDGWDGDAHVEPLQGAAREHYLDGLRAGHVLFAELTSECGGCGGRSYGKDSCRACARG